MTTHQDSSSELREKIIMIAGNMLFQDKSIAQIAKIPKSELEKQEKFADQILVLIAQDRQELLKRIEGELPEKRHIPLRYAEDGLVIHDYNQAIDDCQAIINAIRESI